MSTARVRIDDAAWDALPATRARRAIVLAVLAAYIALAGAAFAAVRSGAVVPALSSYGNIATAKPSTHSVHYEFTVENHGAWAWTVDRVDISGPGISTVRSTAAPPVDVPAHSSVPVVADVHVDRCSTYAGAQQATPPPMISVRLHVSRFWLDRTVSIHSPDASILAIACGS
jgi:hypothetical protein